ncbi:MAG: TetR family transcriptional regulator [Lacisediminihabitans sp.]
MPHVAPRGRPPASSRAKVSETAVELFLEHGYAGTTVAMIAERAGISKTSFFRYFSSKAEIVWSDFDAHTDRLRARLADGAHPDLNAVRRTIVDNLRADLDSGGVSLRRFQVLDTSPDLRTGESLRWFAWAEIVTDHLRDLAHLDYPTPMQAAAGSAMQATMLAVLRDGVRDATAREIILERLDSELRTVCSAFEPLLGT